MAQRKAAARRRREEQARQREAHWRKVLAEWSKSGLTQAAFCRERGLSVSALRWWKRELARRDARKATGQTHVGGGQASGVGRRGFLPVRVVRGPETVHDGQGGLEVVLVSGRRVRVGSEVDAELLGKVVTVLEGLPW